MRSSSLSFSLLHVATWLYIGSLMAVGGLALFSLCRGLVRTVVDLVGTLLQPIGA